jgi:hypothetical protein
MWKSATSFCAVPANEFDMKWLLITLRLIIVCLGFSLTSCIDGHEEYWFAADGSGRAEIMYSVPAIAAKLHGGSDGIRTMIERLFLGNPKLTNTHFEVTQAGDRLTIQLRAHFASVRDLVAISHGETMQKLLSPIAGLVGKTDLKIAGRTVDFTRTIAAAKAVPGGSLIPRSSLADRKLVYVVHLPVEAESANATRTSDGGKTLEWEIPLRDAIAKPVTLHFTGKVPIPLWAWASGGAILVAAVWLAWLAVRRWKRRTARSRSFAPTL